MSSEVLVVPTHAHAAEARAREALASAAGLSMGRGVLTLRELTAALVAAALPGVRPLGPLEERLLLRRVAASPAAREGRFGPVAQTPGFLTALGATFAACRLAGVSAAQLQSVRAALPKPVAARAAAVSELLAVFDAELEAAHAVDPAQLPWAAAAALRDGAPLPSALPAAARVVLRHIHELPPARLALLDALASRLAPSGEVLVELPHESSERPWFAATTRVLERLEAGAEAASISVLPVAPADAAKPEHLGAMLSIALTGADESGTATHATIHRDGPQIEGDGRRRRPRAQGGEAARSGRGDVGVGAGSATHATIHRDGNDIANGDGSVSLTRAPTQAVEHALVARGVRDLVDAGVPPERIAVAVRALHAHAGPLASALTRAGVPVHERRGLPAADAPPLRYLFDVMQAAREGFSRDLVLRLLSNGYADRWRDVRDLARVLGAVAVRENRASKRDEPRLLDALERFAQASDAPGALPKVREAVSDFVKRAAPLGEGGSIVELVARVRRFVDVSGLPEAVRRAPGTLRALVAPEGADPVAAAEALGFGRDQAALDALDAALDELERVAARLDMNEPMSAAELAAVLRDALAEHSISPGGLRGGAVRVLGLRDVAGLDLDAVFLAGLRDGELPAPPVDDPLLSTGDRFAIAKALSARGEGPRYTFDVAEDTRMGHVAFAAGRDVEPLLFHLAAATPARRLFLSYAVSDADGRPVVASPILDEALDALRVARISVAERAPALEPAPSPDDAAGYDEARRALVRAIADVPPATGAAAAALDDPRPRFDPGQDGDALEALDTLDAAGLFERVVIERRRLASMLDDAGTPTAFDGQVGDGHETRPTELSASALEDAARCPFQYFAKRVLRLAADSAGDEDLDPRSRGNVAHACFQATLEALQREGLVPYSAALLEPATEVARRAAEDEAGPRFRSFPIEPTLLPLLREQTIERVVAVVRALYEADDGFTPVAVEQAFGAARPSGDDGESRWPAVTVGGVSLLGRIDLVERRGAAVRVTDLKSGGKTKLEAKLQPAELGIRELQLPIYAAAARAGLALDEAAEVDARYLSLKDGAPSSSVRAKVESNRSKWKTDPRGADEVLRVLREDGSETSTGVRIRELADRMERGDFAIRPAPGACAYCDFAPVCRLPRGAPEHEEAS